MVFVTSSIAIGNSNDARAPQEGVTAVLNTAFDLATNDAGLTVERHKVGLIDGSGNSTFQMIAAVLCLMHLLRRHARVLVHCHEGQSRSPIVVATYLSLHTDATVIHALNFIRQAKSDINPSPALIQVAERAEVLLRRIVFEAA